MFESQAVADLRRSAARVCDSGIDLATGAELADLLRTVRAVTDSLEGLEAAALARFDAVEGFADEGASSTAGWARQHLRLDATQARARMRVGRALAQLPEVAMASRAGRVRLDHLKEFAAGITKAGAETMVEAQDFLVPVAESCNRGELRSVINRLVDVVHPERLDEAWANGMDKADIKVARCGDGFHLSGFVDIVTGASFKTWLDAAAAPRDVDDQRAPSERRLDAVREMVDSVLAHGMPTDRGVRPQLHVTVGLEAWRGESGAEPAVLTGFGPIGADLLDYLRCVCDVTPFLVDGHTGGPTPQANVLNVGRAHRLATHRQRTAVLFRQGGVCANPGCSNTHLEIHHVAWWDRDGGRTDLDNLIGLCPRCHHLVHSGQLTAQTDGVGGFTLFRTMGRRIEDHRRIHQHTVSQRLRRLRDHDAPAQPTRPTTVGTTVQTRRRRAPDHHHPAASIAELRFQGMLHRPRPTPERRPRPGDENTWARSATGHDP